MLIIDTARQTYKIRAALWLKGFFQEERIPTIFFRATKQQLVSNMSKANTQLFETLKGDAFLAYFCKTVKITDAFLSHFRLWCVS